MDFAFTKEQLMFKKEIIRFAKKEIVPRVQEHDLKKQFNFEAFKKLGDFGILGLHFPEELGGSGADVITTVMAGNPVEQAFCRTKYGQIAGTSTEISRVKIDDTALGLLK
jgi:hypothetical protein